VLIMSFNAPITSADCRTKREVVRIVPSLTTFIHITFRVHEGLSRCHWAGVWEPESRTLNPLLGLIVMAVGLWRWSGPLRPGRLPGDIVVEHQKHDVDHRRLIDHEEITVFVLAEASRLGVDLKKPMDRLPRVLLSRSCGWPRVRSARTEEADFFRGEHGKESVEQRRLADAGPTSDHRNLAQRPESR
jgi:hypothetical protein